MSVRRIDRRLFFVWQCCCILLFVCVTALARENFSEVDVLPVQKQITVDGDLKDWDQSCFIETFYDRSLYPNFSAKLGFMYDKQALYIGAHFVDTTPLINTVDPAVNPKEGWRGDCLQVRLISDPAAPYPYVSKSNERDPSDRICHMTFWYYSPGAVPVVNHEYGMDYHSQKAYIGSDSGVVFKKDADNKGYTLEARIPWERLHVDANGIKAGDALILTAQPLWGNADGNANMINYFEITSSRGFAYQSAAGWGRAKFSATGNVTPRVNPLLVSAEENAVSQPLKLKLTLDDPKAKVISLGLFDAEKGLIRSLPVTVRRESELGANFELPWDGLDADGKPIAPGKYELKQLTHEGFGLKFIASLHISGNPPWKTDDGKGMWGGDWSPPLAAASDANCVYLGWGSCEAGAAIISVKKELDANGLTQKNWGVYPALHNDVGFYVTSLATDGDRVFVGQDGLPYGGKGKNIAGVTVYDAHTGRPMNFPFGKSSIPIALWDGSRCADQVNKPLFERRKTGDLGPQQSCNNLTAIAVKGDNLYAALFLDDKIIACNWKTGATIGEYTVASPSGVAVDASGQLLVASGKGLIRIDPQNSAAQKVVTDQLARPWGIAVDSANNICVSDCGNVMQVKIFSPDGKLQRTIGKQGGRAWIGTYDPTGVLMPAGLAMDADGKLWVTENDEFPRRVSVWNAAGKVVGDFHGPCVPQTDRGVDLENPSRINVQMVEYELDYNTGKSKCITTLWRPHADGWTPVSNFGVASRFVIRTVNGRQYGFLDHGYADALGVIFIRKGDRMVPCTSLGFGTGVQIAPTGLGGVMMQNGDKWLNPEQWKMVWDANRKEYFHTMLTWHTWIDINGDGIMQPEELSLEKLNWNDKQTYRIMGVEDDLTLDAVGSVGNVIFRIPVKSFTSEGVPIYPSRKECTPFLSKISKPDSSIWIDNKRQRVFGFDAKGGDSRMRGEYAGVSCYDFAGKLLWLYRDTWLGFALDSPFYKPGLVIGVNKFIGEVDLDKKTSLLVMPGYYGDYSMISSDGLWVHSFCQDNRLGGSASADTVFIENMTGIFYRNKQNGKVYLIGGDIDARVWEVTGLETIRTMATILSITPKDFNAASQAAKKTQKKSVIEAIQITKAGKIQIDGKTTDWKWDHAVKIDAGAGRGAMVALSHDAENLYAAFKVEDRSPMANIATDYALLFKGGDVCDIMLTTDPKADPKRSKPVAGDTRLSLSVLDGKPVCVIYQPVSNTTKVPKTFSSPTGSEAFERVQLLENAKIAIVRNDNGYELEAAIPLAEIGLKPDAGTTLRGDMGVLFGTDGGGRTVVRSYYSNKDTMITEDVPTEARFSPANWTTLEIKE